jgi:uncharacterized membrane protein (UPF0127 family)
MSYKSIFVSVLTSLVLLLASSLDLKCAGSSFTQLFIGQEELTVELAHTEMARAMGLMHRRHLGRGMGMLFVFPDSDYRSFWMKNTLIELDIIYIDTDKRVAHIEAHVPPCKADPCPSYPSSRPARYVLELDGGEAERFGLKIGDRIDFVLPAGLRVE